MFSSRFSVHLLSTARDVKATLYFLWTLLPEIQQSLSCCHGWEGH